jgi:hypothetical protein
MASSVASRLMMFCGAFGIGASCAASVMRAASSISARAGRSRRRTARSRRQEYCGQCPMNRSVTRRQHLGAPCARAVRDRGLDVSHEGDRRVHRKQSQNIPVG